MASVSEGEEFPKRKKMKITMQQKGIKRDLKYIYQKLSMKLQLRSENKEYSDAVTKRKDTAWKFH